MKISAREVLQPWPDVRPDVAANFMEVWFQERLGQAGIVALTPIQAHSGFPSKSAFASIRNMIRALRETTLMADLVSGSVGGREANIYHSASTLFRLPDLARHPYARGRKSDVGWTPGLWLDLDVSDEKFAGADAVLEVVRAMWRLGVMCSMLVATGSGGLHPYFRVKEGLEPGAAERMSERLRVWVLAELSGGASVDRVSNCDRILRTPGSVRFPKAGEVAGAPVLSEIVWCDERRVLDKDRFMAVTELSWQAELANRLARERARADAMAAEGEAFRYAAGRGGEWGKLLAVAGIEQLFDALTWDEILLPHGWELVDGDGAPDGEGRRTWTRPALAGGRGGVGVNRRSMLTDWIENPGVATLKSDSPETGLLGLRDRRVPLNKFRVWLELSEWHGDVTAFVHGGLDDILDTLGERRVAR